MNKVVLFFCGVLSKTGKKFFENEKTHKSRCSFAIRQNGCRVRVSRWALPGLGWARFSGALFFMRTGNNMELMQLTRYTVQWPICLLADLVDLATCSPRPAVAIL